MAKWGMVVSEVGNGAESCRVMETEWVVMPVSVGHGLNRGLEADAVGRRDWGGACARWLSDGGRIPNHRVDAIPPLHLLGTQENAIIPDRRTTCPKKREKELKVGWQK